VDPLAARLFGPLDGPVDKEPLPPQPLVSRLQLGRNAWYGFDQQVLFVIAIDVANFLVGLFDRGGREESPFIADTGSRGRRETGACQPAGQSCGDEKTCERRHARNSPAKNCIHTKGRPVTLLVSYHETQI